MNADVIDPAAPPPPIRVDRRMIDRLSARGVISAAARDEALELIEPPRRWGLWAARLITVIGAALVLAGARWPAWIGLVTFAAHLVWQIRRLDIANGALCLRIFKSNRDAGLLLFAGLMADAALRSAT